MKNKILIVIDMQNDFIKGSLGSEEAKDIVPAVVEKIKTFDGLIYFTRDTHFENYLETSEGKFLPVEHCIIDTEGHYIINDILEVLKGRTYYVYNKSNFASEKLCNDIKIMYERGEVEDVEIIGVCTDICVISNALMLRGFLPELEIKVDSKCCAGVSIHQHECALEVMRACNINII